MADMMLNARYARLAQQGEELIRSGTGNCDLPPSNGGRRWGVSAVLRLPPEVADPISELVAGTPPIEIEYRGILASEIGILVTGWPTGTRRLDDLRDELHRRLARLGPMSGPERERPRDLYNASLAIFVGRIHAPAEALRLLGENADRRFGTAVFDSIEIVRYRLVPGRPPESWVLQRLGLG